MPALSWRWGDGKPFLEEVGQDYDIYDLYLYVYNYSHLPDGMQFSGLVKTALDAQGHGALSIEAAAKHISKLGWQNRTPQQVLDLLAFEGSPHLQRSDWMRLCLLLDLPILLMEVAVVSIE